MNLYASIEAKRKYWQPKSYQSAEKTNNDVIDIISKGLSLRTLEIPVGEFISEGLDRKETKQLKEALPVLKANISDEVKHEEALSTYANNYVQYISKYEEEAAIITKAWVEFDAHPILKAAVLENGCFFPLLAIFRELGSLALRMTSLDISSDEQRHVIVNRQVCKDLGIRPTKAIDELRKATVNWLVSDMPEGYRLTRTSIMKASDELMYSGITKQLDFTRTFTVPAFFEIRSDVLPYYTDK